MRSQRRSPFGVHRHGARTADREFLRTLLGGFESLRLDQRRDLTGAASLDRRQYGSI